MKMRKQRRIGLALVIIAALVMIVASAGETLEERDATASLIIGPLGFYMIFTKEYVLSEERQDKQNGAQLPDRIFIHHTRSIARKEPVHGKKTSN